MADITKCTGVGCSERDRCKRYTASDSILHQSYFVSSPVGEDGTCDMYWGINQVSIMDELESIMKGKVTMTWEQYKDANQLKGRASKKKREEHDKALFVAYFNLYERPQKSLLNDALNIINKN